MGTVFGAKNDITQIDKMKVKSNRFLDQIIRNASKKGVTPGVGHYKNLEKGYEK